MFKETLRTFGVIAIFIVVILDDFPFYRKMKDPVTQLILGLGVIACVYFDTTFGFIMALLLMLIYYEIYKNVKKSLISDKSDNSDNFDNVTADAPMNTEILLDYITEDHLNSAQNNIVSIDSFTTEVKGIEKGLNNESVYGAQGMDNMKLNHIGYNQEDKYHLL